MKLRLKEDPREWRKSVWLTALGLGLVSTVLRWRKVMPGIAWLSVIIFLVLWAILAWGRPNWFRGFYRLSMRVGVGLSEVVARIALSLIFVLILTPLGLMLRIAGKDLLRLKRSKHLPSYWSDSHPSGSFDRMF